jgi:hypothetical protein
MQTEAIGTDRNWPTQPIEIGGVELQLLHTGLTQWLFDCSRRRFLVLPTDASLDPGVFALDWMLYHDLSPTHDGRGVVIRRVDLEQYRLFVLVP